MKIGCDLKRKDHWNDNSISICITYLLQSQSEFNQNWIHIDHFSCENKADWIHIK